MSVWWIEVTQPDHSTAIAADELNNAVDKMVKEGWTVLSMEVKVGKNRDYETTYFGQAVLKKDQT